MKVTFSLITINAIFDTNICTFLIQMCLEKDPLRRWTCDQLLRHPFFDNFSFKYPEGDLYEFEKLKTFREKSKVTFLILTCHYNYYIL